MGLIIIIFFLSFLDFIWYILHKIFKEAYQKTIERCTHHVIGKVSENNYDCESHSRKSRGLYYTYHHIILKYIFTINGTQYEKTSTWRLVPNDCIGINKDKVIQAQKSYAGKMVTIYYNPNDIKEFYVKEIEEEIMLEEFKSKSIIYNYLHGIAKIFGIVCGILFLICLIGELFMNLFFSKIISWIIY